jgi:hypothetical protein
MAASRCLTACCLLAPSVLAAQTRPVPIREVRVQCSAAQTIGQALAWVDRSRPLLLRVSGTCRESVAITGFDDLRIVGASGATVESVAGATAYPISVSASQSVSITGLTIRVTDDAWKPALVFWSCQDCRLTDVTVDGGTAFWALGWSQISLARFTLTGTGGGGIFLGNAKLDMEDSTLGGGAGSRWCGLQASENAVAVVKRSAFREFSAGVCADSGAQVHFWENNVVEGNTCYGVRVSSAGYVALHQSSVRNNASSCWNGGVNVDDASKLVIDGTQVTGNSGGGILLNHQAYARLGGGTVVASNQGSGLSVRNGSMAVAPGTPPETVSISGNGIDVSCDTLSHVNNGAQISGATATQCPNLHSGDGLP